MVCFSTSMINYPEDTPLFAPKISPSVTVTLSDTKPTETKPVTNKRDMSFSKYFSKNSRDFNKVKKIPNK